MQAATAQVVYRDKKQFMKTVDIKAMSDDIYGLFLNIVAYVSYDFFPIFRFNILRFPQPVSCLQPSPFSQGEGEATGW